ncbi:hypothetical protein KFE25_013684 [Diacronema lutheri]|uniref:GH16 domain-containing protein n=2 Tax=Diacronema lutheri TaxID=2081491 RepID=A0A8J5XTF6_DIALT|nr:hypothetical protein KFE25_013684 [Diacronema lutheri]
MGVTSDESVLPSAQKARALESMRPTRVQIPSGVATRPVSSPSTATFRFVGLSRALDDAGQSRTGSADGEGDERRALRPTRSTDSMVEASNLAACGDAPRSEQVGSGPRSPVLRELLELRQRGATAVETIRAYSALLGRALSPMPPAEVLVWSDEFEYTGLPDPTKWGYQTEANAWTRRAENAEQQWYTAEREKNAFVSNGTLKLTARRENYAGCHFTSARLVTKGKGDWRYGRVEVSAKLPAACRGAWPAIWMLPTDQVYGTWPRSGEIDLMEHVGFAEGEVRSSIHTERFNHRDKTHKVGITLRKSAHAKFHTYALDWTPTRLALFVDSQCVLTHARRDEGGVHDATAWPFDQRFHLVLNVAVGGHWAGQQGIDVSRFPCTLEIAHVRVFQRPHGYARPDAVARVLSPLVTRNRRRSAEELNSRSGFAGAESQLAARASGLSSPLRVNRPFTSTDPAAPARSASRSNRV